MRAARSPDVSPFIPAARDLGRSFHARTLESGARALREGRVSTLDVEVVSTNLIELRAQVAGRDPSEDGVARRYQVGVRLARKNAGTQVEIESHCSCPIGDLCKHAAAVLMAWQPQWAHDLVADDDAPAYARPWGAPAEALDETPVPAGPERRLVHGRGTVCLRLGASGAPQDPQLPAQRQPPGAALFASLRIEDIEVPLQRAATRISRGDAEIDVEPDARQVERALAALQDKGANPWSHPAAPRARRPGESAFQIREDALARLVDESVAQWRAQGWEVRIDADFPWQVVEIDDIEMNLREAPAQGGLQLDLGLRIGDKRVALLPLLDAALAEGRLGAPGGGRLREAPEESNGLLQMRIDAGHIVRVPRERIQALLEALIEVDPRRPGRGGTARPARRRRTLSVSTADLARIAGLADRGVATWVGAPDLRAFAQRLTGFTHVESARVPAGLAAELRPYQRAGLNWLQFLRTHGLGGLLADDMGLGKTLQTMAHICLEKEEGRLAHPALVVAPTSLVHNWIAEAARFVPGLRTLQLHGTERHRDFERMPEADLVVTSFALLARDIDRLVEQPFHLLIVDEAQNIKNPRTQSAMAVRRIQATHRLALSGTPLENHLGELWAQFDWLAPGLLGDAASFARLYRVPVEKRGDEQRRRHLQARIRPFVLRRRKDEVTPELPRRTDIERFVALEPEQRELYEAVRASVEERVRLAMAEQGLDRSQMLILDALLKLRQVCCDPRLLPRNAGARIQGSAKLGLLMEMLESLLPEGRRVLVFSQFTSMLALIEKELQARGWRYALLTGDTRDRAGAVDQFQSGAVPLFLLSLRAGGAGLNLTAADTVIHYDPWWNPAVEAQATDRAHRIGQDKPVFVYRLLCAGTIEERMRQLQARKARLAQALLGDEAGLARALGPEDIAALLAPSGA
jgi:superfamily II DNA or RNA helicase